MPHKSIQAAGIGLLILFTLTFETHAAEKPRNHQQQISCEFLLFPNDGNPNDFANADAASIFDGLDYDSSEKVLVLEPGLKNKALYEFFDSAVLDKVRTSKLSLRTRHEIDLQFAPELEIYIQGENNFVEQDQILSIINGPSERIYSYIKDVTNINFQEKPLSKNDFIDHRWIAYHSEVGFTSPGLSSRDILRRYVTVKMSQDHRMYLTVGIDVPCAKVADFIKTGPTVIGLVTEKGLVCRIPVMRADFALIVPNDIEPFEKHDEDDYF